MKVIFTVDFGDDVISDAGLLDMECAFVAQVEGYEPDRTDFKIELTGNEPAPRHGFTCAKGSKK